MINAIVPITDWSLKREVLLSRNKNIAFLHNTQFKSMHDGRKLSKNKYSAYLHNFTKAFYNYYDRIGHYVSTEDTFCHIKQDYGEHLEELLFKIYEYKPKFFFKHVQIKFLYKVEIGYLNIPHKAGVYQVCFDQYMLSFIKQCKFYAMYEQRLWRLMFWIDNVFSETEENKKKKVQDIDSMFDKVCKPLFDSNI